MVIGAVNELPPLTTDVESVVETTDESVVGNAPGCVVPSAVKAGLEVAGDDGAPATTELSSVGKSGGAVAFGLGEALLAIAGFS
jgi:hypothetical protein